MPLKWHKFGGWLGCCHRYTNASTAAAGVREAFAAVCNWIFAIILKNDDFIQTESKQTTNSGGCEVKDGRDFDGRRAHAMRPYKMRLCLCATANSSRTI